MDVPNERRSRGSFGVAPRGVDPHRKLHAAATGDGRWESLLAPPHLADMICQTWENVAGVRHDVEELLKGTQTSRGRVKAERGAGGCHVHSCQMDGGVEIGLAMTASLDSLLT